LATSQALPAMVIQEMRRHQRYLEHRMERLQREALRLIARDRELNYFTFSYSALVSFRTGMSGPASFQRAKKSS
jgi:hypothetical protein